MITETFDFDLPEDIELGFDDVNPGEVKFKYNDEMRQAVPQAEALFVDLMKKAEEVVGHPLESLGPETVWVMGVRGPGDGIGEHREGFPGTYTLLLALNSIPDSAGGVLNIENDDRDFHHRKGRAVIFPSQNLHGNKTVTEPVLRVTLAGLVQRKS